jgi:hypothetical protein
MPLRGDRLRQNSDSGDDQVVALLASSAFVRRADRAVQWATKVIQISAIAATSRHAAAEWWSIAPSRRRFSIGLTLAVAAFVNVVLTVATGSIPGWVWAVIPGLAAAVGAAMMLSGAAARKEQE